MTKPQIIKQFSDYYYIARPVLLVMFFAALIVFVNSYPNVPGIAEETKDYRQQVINKINQNGTEQNSVEIIQPKAPSLPNTIAPVISPEEVDEIVNPQPKPKTQPPAGNETNATPPESTTTRDEPPLEIKLLTGFLNVAPLILIAAVGGFGIYLLFKYRKHVTIRSLFGTAIALVAICTLIFFGAITVDFFDFLYEVSFDSNFIALIVLPIAIPIGIWISYCVISKKTTIFKRNMGIAFSGALMGAFLASFLPFWIVFLLLVGIALFDMYSVKYGPIKKILDLEEQVNSKKKIPLKKPEKQIIYRTLNNPSGKMVEGIKLNPKANDENHVVNTKTGSSAEFKIQKIDPEEKTTSNFQANPGTHSEKGIKDASRINRSHNTFHSQHQKTTSDIHNPSKNPSKSESITQPSAKITNNKKETDDEFDLILMYDNPDWSLGLGDFVIYSMFTSAVLTYFLLYLPYYIFYNPTLGLILPWILFLICALGLLLGFVITLKLLQKRDYLPGLPITIASGFLVFVICIIILQLINYLIFKEFAIII